MTRLGHFIRSLASGYAVLFGNMVFTLASIPIAGHYLTHELFGVWALVTQIGGFLGLIDFGMSTSMCRQLIDHKDERDGGAFGSILKTSWLVQGVQALAAVVVLVALVGTAPFWLNVPSHLQSTFLWLMLIQGGLVAAAFPARTFGTVLIASHRIDICNYAQLAQMVTNLGGLMIAFRLGWGVFALAWAGVVGFAVSTVIMWIACSTTKVFPRRGCWGTITRKGFNEAFRFGRDVFWMTLGAQLSLASQTIVVTQTLGVERATTWYNCTRAFTLLWQIVSRPFDFAFSGLSEMIVRGERELFARRLRDLIGLIAALAAVAGVGLAAANSSFVAAWLKGWVFWDPANDVLLGIWLLPLAISRCACTFLPMIKEIGFARYVYVIEGVLFVAIGSALASRFGFAGLLAAGVLSVASCSAAYALRRMASYLRLSLAELAKAWLLPVLRLLVVMIPIAWLLCIATSNLTAGLQFLTRATVIGTVGCYAILHLGISTALRDELRERLPAGMRRWLVFAA